MSGSLFSGGGENIPGIPGACTTRNFTYVARSPLTCTQHAYDYTLHSSPYVTNEEIIPHYAMSMPIAGTQWGDNPPGRLFNKCTNENYHYNYYRFKYFLKCTLLLFHSIFTANCSLTSYWEDAINGADNGLTPNWRKKHYLNQWWLTLLTQICVTKPYCAELTCNVILL